MHIADKAYTNIYPEIGTIPPCKALIIDDDEQFVEELTELLEGLGYPTMHRPTAFDGLAAMALDHSIGIILCDYRLPDMVGLDLAREIARLYAQDRPFAFILISGYANLDLALEALRVGVDDFLTKPIRPGEIARALRDGLDVWRIRTKSINQKQESSRANGAEPLMLRAGLRNPLLPSPDRPELFAGKEISVGSRDGFDEACQDLLNLLLLVNRERERLLHKSIFGDPAWEISIELLKRGLRNEAIPVSSACTASCAPLTTSLRWVRNMEKLNLVERWNDPKDKRRDLIKLSDDYLHELNKLLRSVMRKWMSGEYI